MPGERFFLQDLALVLCVAAVTTVLFRRLRQPVVLGYLLAGLIVGPYTPGQLLADPQRIQTVSELGVILVMFSIGLGFSLRKLAHVFPRAGLVALIQIGTLAWLGYVAAQALGWSAREGFFTAAMVAISSTMIVAKAFDEQKIEGELADLVFGVLVVQDLAAILFLALLTALSSGAAGTTAVLFGTAGRLLGFLFAITVAGYLFVPRTLRFVARLASPETLLVACVGLCFALATLAWWAGYPVALGAFVAGALVAESGKHRQVEPLVRPLRDLFAAVFFVAVGMLVDPLALKEHWAAVLVLALVVLAGQVASVSFGAFLGGHDPSTALRAGMSLAQIGEFSFILAGAGVAAGAIDAALYSVAVSVSVVTAFTTPWMIRASQRVALGIEHRLPRPLRTVATLYAAWLEEKRRASGGQGRRYRLLRLAGLLALDVLLFAGVVIATALTRERLQVLLLEAGTGASAARALVLLGAALVAAPFGLGIVRLAAALGGEFAGGALARDPSAVPRRVFLVTLQLAVFAVVAGPLLALTQPFVPVLYEAGVVLAGLALIGWVYWRNASRLEAHVRTGAQMVVEVLRRQNELGPGAPEPTLEAVQPKLSGLGELAAVRLDPASGAVGRTLAQLDLRARTGASVIAITREQGGVVAPTGREELRAGDVLALAGTHEAVQEARLLLVGAALPRPRAAPVPRRE